MISTGSACSAAQASRFSFAHLIFLTCVVVVFGMVIPSASADEFMSIDERISIRNLEHDAVSLSDLDQGSIKAELLQAALDRELDEKSDQRAGVRADDGSLIDVMVLYSPGAARYLGGARATRDEIDWQVTRTNQSYVDSGVSFKIRLVHVAQTIGYSESSDFINFFSIPFSNNGVLDNVHGLRRKHGADLVVVISMNTYLDPTTRVCGVGFLPNTLDRKGDIVAFSHVSALCLLGQATFSHELGHNLGARHDRKTESGGIRNQYNYGHVLRGERYRTIMSYMVCRTYCPRLNLWSNPSLSYRNSKLGIAPPHARASYNVRTLNEHAIRIAKYRRSKKVQKPAIVVPANKGAIDGSQPVVHFVDNATNVSAWRIKVGQKAGGSDYYESPILSKAARSAEISGVPADGRRAFVTLEYRVGRSWKRAVHRYQFQPRAIAEILKAIPYAKGLLYTYPTPWYTNAAKRAYLNKRLQLLERAANAGNIRLVKKLYGQFESRTDGCGSFPDGNDYVRHCQIQRDIRVPLSAITSAVRRL